MNSQPVYKTAAELRIAPWERDGLAALVGPLSRGELCVAMDKTYSESDCGTVACIGGFLAARADIPDPHDYVCHQRFRTGRPLIALFYPQDRCGHIRRDVSSQQAASAIVNFLTLGDPRWTEVMGEA